MRTLILALLVALSPAAAISAPCTGDGPEAVLDCLVDAYTNRDIPALEDLYAEDYQYVFGDEAACWNREEGLRSSEGLFDREKVLSLEVFISDDFTLRDGPDPNTWIIDGLEMSLVIEAIVKGETYLFDMRDQPSKAVVHVRLVEEPERHYQIYRWWMEAK